MKVKPLWGKVGLVGSGRLANSLALLAIDIVFAHRLAPAVFGTYRQSWLFLGVLLPVFSFGLPTALFYFYPRLSGPARRTLIFQTALLLFVLGGLAAVGLWMLAPALGTLFENPYLSVYLRPFSLYIGAMIATAFVDALLLSTGYVQAQLTVTLLHVMFLVLATILPVLCGSDLRMVFRMLAVVGMVRAVGLILYGSRWGSCAIRTYRPIHALHLREYMDLPLLREQLRYATPLGLSAALGALCRWLDKVIISSHFPPEAYAVFEVGAREIPFVPVLLGSVSTVLLSELNRIGGRGNEATDGDRATMLQLWQEATVRVATVLIPLSVFLFAFAGQIVPFVFSARLAGAVAPFRIYLLMLPLRIAAYGPMIMALGRPRAVLWGIVGDLSGNLILSLLLVRWIGLLGPAISTVIMTYGHVGFLLWMIRKTAGVRRWEVLPWRRLGTVGGATLIALGLAAPLLGWHHPPFSLVVGGIPFGLVVLWLNRGFARSYSS